MAIEIARGNDDALSVALSEAYQSGQLRGENLRATEARCFKDRSAQVSREGHKQGMQGHNGSLVRDYEQTVDSNGRR